MDEFNDPYIDELLAGQTKPRGQLAAQQLRRHKSSSISSHVASTAPRATDTAPSDPAPNDLTSSQQRPNTSADFYRRGLEELEKPTDYSSAVESQKQNRTAAERALMLALMAGQAGPEHQAVQKHFLGRAETSPLKLQGATVDERGNVVQDPNFARERRGEILFRRGDVLTQEERKKEEAEARKEENAARRAARAEEKAEDRALRAMIAGNRPGPQERMVPVVDESGNTVYMPASQASGMKVPAKPGSQKLMPESAIKDIAGMEGDTDRLGSLEATFKKTYGPSAPLTGKLENWLGSQVGTDASNWYSRYQSWSNEVLKRMSGSAVTAPEFARFEAAMLSPNTPATEVPRRLQQQREALANARNKLVDTHTRAGYSTGTLGTQPVPSAPGPGQPVGGGGWSIKKVSP